MNKIQKYNNILFAIIVTGGILISIIALLMELFSSYRPGTYDDPLDNQEIVKLLEKNKIKQTISYEQGHWAWIAKNRQKDGSIRKFPVAILSFQ